MRQNRTSEWKFMTIWISRELLLINFERLDILCAVIGPPSEKLWPFEFHESFRCSISSVSIYYAPESDLRVKSFDHLNFSIASVIQFRVSRHIMRPNRTSVWKAMTIWISRELSLFNFLRLDILCAWIGPLAEKLWPFEFLESFLCLISSVSIYYTPESDLRVKGYDHLKILRASIVQFRASRSLESDIRMKCYDHWNFSRVSVVQFRVSRWVMSPNRRSVWKVKTIGICREHPLINFELLIYYIPESNICVKSYDDSNWLTTSVVLFRASR